MTWTYLKIRQLRLELSWSQAEMGRRLGIDHKSYAALESGELSINEDLSFSLDGIKQNLRDYSKSLSFNSSSDKYLKENSLNQISQFDLESIEDN